MATSDVGDYRDGLPITPPKKGVSGKQSRKRKRSKEEVSSIEMGQYHRKSALFCT